MPKGVYERKPENNAAMSEIITNSKAAKAANDAKRGVPLPPEWCAAISATKTGVPKSPEHCAALSDSMKNSESAKAESERQRGGNDIVEHHFIYDHINPKNHIVKITRSQHASHHNWMRRNGLEVPHLNVTEENKDIFKNR